MPRARFDLVRYANCWEDATILRAALRPAPGKRFLSIASAGDNCFALLADGAEVVAADLSAPQLALVELKREAIRRLDDEPLLRFLGARRALAAERLAALERLAVGLSPTARRYWSERPAEVAAGVNTRGRFEAYFRLFRRFALPFVHRRATVLALLVPRDAAGRREFYDRVWDGWRWRLLFRLFFSRFVMGHLGRSPEFFAEVEGSVAGRILERTEFALTVLAPSENPWIEQILVGRFNASLPPYLEPALLAGVRENLDRLVLCEGPIDEVALARKGAGFDGFNLSDLFEYLDPETSAALYERLLSTANPGARFAYWNLFVPRKAPASVAARVRSLDDEAARLFALDRTFFYRAFVVEEAVS